jgi:hypothetical protein
MPIDVLPIPIKVAIFLETCRMTDRKKDLLFQTALLALLILFFSRILFTGKIIRAYDITNSYYWVVLSSIKQPLISCFQLYPGAAGWDMLTNSGTSAGGGMNSLQFLNFRNIIYHLIPPPESVAWFIVLHLFFGAAGVYCYCRLIGASRLASFFGGLIFAVAPENASLINAGHVMKIATISFAPWAFYFFEKGFRNRRLIFFLTTGFVLAFQFFNTHWQIAYYTCLGIGVYGLARTLGIICSDPQANKKESFRLIGLNMVVVLFFLSTVAISLVPLAGWSQDTNRGSSDTITGKTDGGLNRDEAMSWSLPPEELGAFVIPGFFGFSRQESGDNPANILSYYWGRMQFTQTISYIGLLPWLLLPLPLIFRRDRYTWLAMLAIAGGILFSMGKYTPFYNFLFDHLPGINRFRVPKMMMFIPVMGLSVMSARGLDVLLDEEKLPSKKFRRYLHCLPAIPVILILILGTQLVESRYWINSLLSFISLPNSYEQGPQLVANRWSNLVIETGIAASFAATIAAAIFFYSRKWLPAGIIPFVLIFIYLEDVGRVDAKFQFLVDAPHKMNEAKSPLIEFLSKKSKEYRVLPMDDSDSMIYISNGIPVMFRYNPAQKQRWQNFIEAFSATSAMPDLLNVKYLIYGNDKYAEEKAELGTKYQPVFQLADSSKVVLENKTVLPKAWLVPSVMQARDLQNTFAILQNPAFDPRKTAVVESPAPYPMEGESTAKPFPAQNVTVARYEAEDILIGAKATQNALLVLGEKYYEGWKVKVDGKPGEIYPVNHILRGVYLKSGDHKVEFMYDPFPYKVGKLLTLMSCVFYAIMIIKYNAGRIKKVFKIH